MALNVDGLECGRFDRELLLDLRRGGVDCVTVTCEFWADAAEALDVLGRWRDLARENDDLTAIARTADEVEAIAGSGRVALLLGFQNASMFQSRIRYVELFADLGVRVVQLTYNNQNSIGGSCYEPSDSGLSRFGREAVRELNRHGVLIDLSHTGTRTGLETIEHSAAPVAVTHANPSSLYEHRRNKPDELIRRLAERGGVIGCATYNNISGPAYAGNVDRWCEMVAGTVEIAGIDHVGIGTDHGGEVTEADTQWMRVGRWTRGVDYGAASAADPHGPPEWFESVSQFSEIGEGLARQGFSATEIEALMGGNWMRLYRQVLGVAA